MSTQAQLIKAVQVATRKLASSGNFDVLVKDVLLICVEAVGASGGTIYLHEPALKRLRFEHVLPESVLHLLPSLDIPDDFGIAGAAFQGRQTVRKEYPAKPESEWNEFEKATGVQIRSFLATPLMLEDEEPIGVVQLLNKEQGSFTDQDAAVMDTVAAVSTMAYVNYRLTEESTRASSLLGMGKVGHDIGNLAASLYANIAFSDFAIQNLRSSLASPTATPAEKLIDDMEPTFADLKSSVERIVGYSRLMSDMSAGRELRPNRALGPLSKTIRTAVSYLEPECRANNVLIVYEIDDSAPPFWHDDLYVFRIVQNLAGNAVKAVRETIPDEWSARREGRSDTCGEVVIRYRFCEDHHVIEVSDSGPGMSVATINRILNGTVRSNWDKASGSGWGTRIVLELAATHGGKVSIESTLGNGSTFRVKLPHVEPETVASTAR
ncbi:MAG: GAF domain-containing sensor histidine kinase [Fimbriimonadaceae bacterium]